MAWYLVRHRVNFTFTVYGYEEENELQVFGNQELRKMSGCETDEESVE
jgi:hypothetical protein